MLDTPFSVKRFGSSFVPSFDQRLIGILALPPLFSATTNFLKPNESVNTTKNNDKTPRQVCEMVVVSNLTLQKKNESMA
jgi:hypothetical protein